MESAMILIHFSLQQYFNNMLREMYFMIIVFYYLYRKGLLQNCEVDGFSFSRHSRYQN